MWDYITKVLIVVIPSVTTIITSIIAERKNKAHSAKQSIFQLILEDKIRVAEGKIPENKQAICDEYDQYSKNGGNSYVHEKVDDYLNWYSSINKKIKTTAL